MGKRKKPAKERTDSVYATVNVERDGQLSVRYDFETDQIEILGAIPGSTKAERRYERPSGKSTAADGWRVFLIMSSCRRADTPAILSGDRSQRS